MNSDGLTFYFDLGSPYAWVVAERLSKSMQVAEWQPVLQPAVDDGPLWDGDQDRIYDFAQKFGLLRPKFNDELMNQTIADTRNLMLAATYAKSIGRTVAFTLAAFRQIFAAARPIDDTDTILLAAAACEMHPRAILKALETKSVNEHLDAAGAKLKEQVGGRTELPLLLGTAPNGEAVNATEDALFSLALAEFASLKPSE